MHSQFPLFIFSIIFLLQFRPIFGDNLENIRKFKNAGELKEALMAWIAFNNDFFDAGMGNAVFWSGKRRESAEGWAKQNGKSILEMTRGGKILEKLNLFKAPANAVLTAKEALEVWGKASALFAEQAKGDVHVFSTGTTVVNPRGHIRTWFRIEEHILMCNKNVENIYRMKKDGKLMQRKMYKKPNCNLEKLLGIYENEENIPEHLRSWPGAEEVQQK